MPCVFESSSFRRGVPQEGCSVRGHEIMQAGEAQLACRGCTCWVCLLWQLLQDVCRQMHLDLVAPPLIEMLTGSLVYLQGSNNVAKVQAMQRAIKMLLNGDQLPALFITIVRYVLPSEDHNVQKLLLLYLVRPCIGWERSCLLLEGFRAPRCKMPVPSRVPQHAAAAAAAAPGVAL